MVNNMVLQGRLTADIELRYTRSGVALAEFTVAWSEKYKDVETKCFLRCKAWKNTAEFLGKYFQKGQELVIVGHMVTEQWEADGGKKSRTICQVDKVSFCGKKEDGGKTGNNQNPGEGKPDGDGFMNIPDGIDEELPFN